MGSNVSSTGAFRPLRPPNPLLLVVESEAEVRGTVRDLARRRGFDVVEAVDAAGGLEATRTHRPDLVLLDAEMRGANGRAVIDEMRDEDPSIAVVVLGDPTRRRKEIERALSAGALNFLKKPLLAEEVGFLLNEMYLALEDEADLRQVPEIVVNRSTRLVVPSRPQLISKVVSYLGREVRNNYPGLRIAITEIKLALYEAISNAMEHGNLRITFEEKSRALDTREGLMPLVQERLADPVLAARRVFVRVHYRPDHVSYRVRDQGSGFRPEHFGRAQALANTSALHGRGIALIRHYMSRVAWNARGNEILMIRRMRAEPAGARTT